MKTTFISKKTTGLLCTAFVIFFSNASHAQWTGATPAPITTNQEAIIGTANSSSTVTTPTTKFLIQEDNPVLELNDVTTTSNTTNSVGLKLTTSTAAYQLSTMFSSAMGPCLSLKNSTGIGYHIQGNTLWVGGLAAGSANINFQGPTFFQGPANFTGNSPVTITNTNLSVSNGKVTVGTAYKGTTHTDYQISASGKIIASSIYALAPANWADYVFEKEYKLTSLEDIETYVKQNKHLPEVPTTKEVGVNGINLGEMDVILLKKIEELTLHMIEMKKELKQLEAENNELKNANNRSK